MSLIIRMPSGPLRPILLALDELEILEGYLKAQEDSARHQSKQLKEHGWKEKNGRLYHTFHDLDGEAWHLGTLFDDYFPHLQRSSTLITILGLVESWLNELCDELAISTANQLRVRDLRGSGINRAKVYLSKVACLGVSWNSGLWDEIRTFQKLRNIVVHNAGKISEQDNQLQNYAEQSPHLSIVDPELRICETFLPHVIERLAEFFLRLEQAIKLHEAK